MLKSPKCRTPKFHRSSYICVLGDGQVIELITNHFWWCVNTITELYKSRWQVEIFFRDVKQLLHIKSSIGTYKNAVMIQIRTALITILILKVLKNTIKI